MSSVDFRAEGRVLSDTLMEDARLISEFRAGHKAAALKAFGVFNERRQAACDAGDYALHDRIYDQHVELAKYLIPMEARLHLLDTKINMGRETPNLLLYWLRDASQKKKEEEKLKNLVPHVAAISLTSEVVLKRTIVSPSHDLFELPDISCSSYDAAFRLSEEPSDIENALFVEICRLLTEFGYHFTDLVKYLRPRRLVRGEQNKFGVQRRPGLLDDKEEVEGNRSLQLPLVSSEIMTIEQVERFGGSVNLVAIEMHYAAAALLSRNLEKMKSQLRVILDNSVRSSVFWKRLCHDNELRLCYEYDFSGTYSGKSAQKWINSHGPTEDFDLCFLLRQLVEHPFGFLSVDRALFEIFSSETLLKRLEDRSRAIAESIVFRDKEGHDFTIKIRTVRDPDG